MDASDAARVIPYLEGVAGMTLKKEDRFKLEELCFDLAISHGDLCTAMRLALSSGEDCRVGEVFEICLSEKNRPRKDRMTSVIPLSAAGWWPASARVVYEVEEMDSERLESEVQLRRALQLQMAHQIARHRLGFPIKSLYGEGDEIMAEDSSARVSPTLSTQSVREMVEKILRREQLPYLFEYLAKELDVLEPRKPDEVFKTELEEGRNRRPARGGGGTSGLDAARLALVSAYVSGFVHAGFKTDSLLTVEESAYIHKARANGVTAATAAIGLIALWNVEDGLTQIDKFQYSSESFTKAGAYLAFGINSTNVAHECDPVLTLVPDGLNSSKVNERLAAAASLGYAYAGTAKEEVSSLLVPLVLDLETVGGLEVSSAAALALGMVFVGTACESVAEALVQTMIERAETDTGIDTHHAFNLAVAFALLYLQQEDAALPAIASLAAVHHPLGQLTQILTEALAFTGSADVVRTQEMISLCMKKVDLLLYTESCEDGEPSVSQPTAVQEQPVTAEAALTTAAAPTAPSTDKQSDGRSQPNADETDTVEIDPTEPAEPLKPVTATAQVVDADNKPTTSAKAEANSSSSSTANAGPSAATPSSAAVAIPVASRVREEFRTLLPGVCVIALPLLNLKEDLGSEMLIRLFNHFLQFDDLHVRRAVPVALMLLSASNPKPVVVDLLSRLSHDPDADTALHAIIALGVVAAGTNNARVAQMLRQLAVYYAPDSNALFLVRVAQGLLYCSKGLVSLSPLHSDRTLIDKTALAGLVAFAVQSLFTKNTLCHSRYHLNLYHLIPAIHPRWLITLKEDLQPVQIPVRVGQAVDTAGLAGEPKKITGFRTHNTPVLLAYDEKAQIGTDEWQALTEICEGIVIVRKLKGKEKTYAARALE